jgi:hypothetical protein
MTNSIPPLEDWTREQLMRACTWNDPNGCYTDWDSVIEFGSPTPTHVLRDIVRDWIAEDPEAFPLLARAAGRIP